MSVRLITYTDANMTISAHHCVNSGLKHGVNTAVIYTPDLVSYDFKWMNADIWKSGNRGADCFWLFKPYIIYDAMLSMSEGDILIYSDAGCQFIDNVNHIISRMKDDFFFMTNGFKHVEWCKGDTLVAFFGDECFPKGDQIQASLLFFRVNDKTKRFVKEWFCYCQMPGLINDDPSYWDNYPTFADHRHDQAVLTCMAIKHGIDYNNLWCDTLWSNQRHRWPHCDYPPIVLHHRRRDHEWK